MRIKKIFLKNDLIINIFFSGGAQGTAAILSLLLTPLYIDYFESNVILGVWLTIVSLLDAISLLDLGIGNGLRNRLAEALAQKNEEKARRLISSCYVIVLCVCLILSIIWLIVAKYINWNQYLNVSATEVGHNILTKAVMVVGIAVFVQMFLKLITSVLYAMQKAAIVSWQPVLSNCLLVFFLFLSKNFQMEIKIICLAVFYAIFINIPYLITTFIIFKKKYKELCPRFKEFDIKIATSTLKLGLLFFYLTLMSMLTHNTNEILITYLYSPDLVVEYQIYNKIYTLIITGMNIIMVPIWSALTKEITLCNFEWVNKAHKYLCMLSGGALIAGIILAIGMQLLVDAWLGDNNISVKLGYCIPFILYVTENTIGGANATVANGCGWLKAQIILAPLSALLNIPITILLKLLIGDWSAIVYANVISLLPITIGQYIYIRRKIKCTKVIK